MKPRGTFRGPEIELGTLRCGGACSGEVRAQDVPVEGVSQEASALGLVRLSPAKE